MYLPKGTKLYHGTISKNFILHNSITYFGLDKNISIWYILNRDIELWLNSLLILNFNKKIKKKTKKNKKKSKTSKKPKIPKINYEFILKNIKKYETDNIGYLYVFKTKKDIKISNIIETMDDHPTYYDNCLNDKDVCIHPHLVYRSPFFVAKDPRITPQIFSVSTELTMRVPYHLNNLDLIKVETIDISKLNKYKNDKKRKPKKDIIS